MLEIKLDEKAAEDVFNDILVKLEIQDLDRLFQDTGDKKTDGLEELVKKAIRCGLVYWDNQDNCLVQTLINKIDLGGNISAEKLNYKKFVTLGLQDKLVAGDVSGILAELTERPAALVDRMRGQDASIASALVKCFFGK